MKIEKTASQQRQHADDSPQKKLIKPPHAAAKKIDKTAAPIKPGRGNRTANRWRGGNKTANRWRGGNKTANRWRGGNRFANGTKNLKPRKPIYNEKMQIIISATLPRQITTNTKTDKIRKILEKIF